MKELVPVAIECGMDLDMFWWDDEDYFNAYFKAYKNRLDTTAWYNGIYILEAMQFAIATAIPPSVGVLFDKKSFDQLKKFSYPSQPKTNVKKVEKKEITEEDKEKQWRDQLMAINNLFS